MPQIHSIIMIQRIQSIYLALVGVFSGGLIFVFCFWKDVENQPIGIQQLLNHPETMQKAIGIAFFVIAFLALVSLFSFKKRKLQLSLNRINILINLILLGVLAYLLLNVSGEMEISEKGIGSFIPSVSTVLLVLANRGIQKDEDLVKSVDRLR